jgi:hypothetical protein
LTKTLQQLWEGEKPSEALLTLTDELMHDFEFQIGQTVNYEGKPFIIRDIGDAIRIKIRAISKSLLHHILKKPTGQEEEMTNISRIKMLIPYWYALKWLPPLKDYAHLLPVEKRPESESYIIESQESKMYLEGRKPPEEIISRIDNYMKCIHIPIPGGPIAFLHLHGAGKITGSMSPVEKVSKFIQGGGAKLGKEFWGLEWAQTNQERDRIYRECIGLAYYWTLKEWNTIPNPSEPIKSIFKRNENEV